MDGRVAEWHAVKPAASPSRRLTDEAVIDMQASLTDEAQGSAQLVWVKSKYWTSKLFGGR
jgi:hypothetical protein